MRSFKIYLAIFISLSCICGMCSKEDVSTPGDNGNGSSDNYKEPAFNENDTWVYMTSGSLPTFYPSNVRPALRKWVATKILPAVSGALSTGGNYLSFSFENTDTSTRFLTNELNPGGKESLSISLLNFTQVPPIPDSYTMDIDYKQGYCWYYVYNASNDLVDSVRTQGLGNSSLTISKWTFVDSTAQNSVYKMSGTASIEVMYFKPGTSSTNDVQNLQCTFNNVPVTFIK